MKKRFWIYTIVVGLFVLVIAGVLHVGDLWVARVPDVAGGTAVSQLPEGDALSTWRANAAHPVARLIIQLIAIVGVARLFGAFVRWLGQPPVIGEIAAGIALGPSLLGAAAPDVSALIFPTSSMGMLQLFSQVGVILFMFVVGLELDWSLVRTKAHVAVAVSHVSILFPFFLGVLVAIPLFGEYAPTGISFHAFGLFMGIAMSITAFPVLARILEERGLSKTSIGSTALTCAAVDDVTAWTLLTFVVAVVTSGGALFVLLVTLGLAIGFVLTMVFCVRRLLGHLLTPSSTHDPFSKERLAIVVGVLFASALATELIGVHALFGAFVAGAIMPVDDAFRRGLRNRLESFSSVFLLPVFFAYTGLRTEIGLLNTAGAWIVCLALIALATVGKLGGSAVTARVMGLDARTALALGALMNTRGLMELVALNVGYDLGVISPEIFTALVLMALVTTSLTGPLLDFALAGHSTGEITPPAGAKPHVQSAGSDL